MPTRIHHIAGLVTGLAVAVIVSGCGAQSYEHRLEESRKYFEYRQTVDSILDAKWWQAGSFGLQFRVPKDFVEIPGPVKPEDPDTRQPTFLPRPLSGLVGAWEARVPVDIEDSDITEQRAWIFICTNHQDLLAKNDDPLIEPDKFTQRLIENIAFNLRYEAPTEASPWPFVEERTPTGTPYVPRKNYVSTQPPLDDRVNIRGSGEVNMSFMLNQLEAGPIQMTLIAAYPSAVDSSYRIENRIKTAMETLRLSEEVPRPQRAGQPQTSGGGF